MTSLFSNSDRCKPGGVGGGRMNEGVRREDKTEGEVRVGRMKGGKIGRGVEWRTAYPNGLQDLHMEGEKGELSMLHMFLPTARSQRMQKGQS